MAALCRAARRYWGLALNPLNIGLSVVSLAAALAALYLPLNDWIGPHAVPVALRVALPAAAAFMLFLYVPARVVQKLEQEKQEAVQKLEQDAATAQAEATRNFYARDLRARADRAHRVFCDLLRVSHRLCLEPPDQRPEKVQIWDRRVRDAIITYCKPGRLDMYYGQTRAISAHYQEERLAEDRIGVAQEALARLLEAIADEPEVAVVHMLPPRA